MTFSLSESEIGELVASLEDFHREYGNLDQLLDAPSLERLHNAHRDFLLQLLGNDNRDGEALARVYIELNLPFHLLTGCLNHIKSELLRIEASRHRNEIDPVQLYSDLNALFDAARQQAALHYLHTEASASEPLDQAQMQNRLLIRLYRDWLERVNRALLDGLEDFPLTSAADSRFTEALQYPESLLICLDLKTCDHILEQHRLIRQKAGILYAMLAAERYDNAYLAYRETRQMVNELTQLLGVLYFESQTNRIQSFFNFVQAALYLPGEKFFCVVNLRRLNHINQMYGVENGDRSLQLLDDCLSQLLEKHQSWMVYTRGIAGDFYLHCLRCDRDRVEALMDEIEVCVAEQQQRELPFPMDLMISGINLTELSDLTTENMHLIVDYLSRANTAGKSRVQDSREELDAMMEWIRQRYRQSIDLAHKLDRDNIEVFIQPLVELDARQQIHAFEVLGRFREQNGYISAGMFIGDIIRLGLIERFDRLVLERLVQLSEELREITGRLFINVSALTLEDEGYIRTLNEAMQGPLAGFEIVLELTEQTLLENLERIYQLREQHGLNFAIDDFGTGFSSLQTVIELALRGGIQYLKVDGSLTSKLNSNPASEQIIRITRQMARELGLSTVVEFVETHEQLHRLEAIDIDLGQGYLLGVPDPVSVWLGKMVYLRSKQLQAADIGLTTV